MIQIKTIVTALLGLSAVSCTPLVLRDASAVLADLATIGTDISTLNSDVESYTGGVLGALSIATDENTLDEDINQATTDTNAADDFSVADSTSVVAAVASLTPQITSALSELSSQEPLFAASGLDSLVQSLLQTLQSDTDALSAALQAKAQPSDVYSLEIYQIEIDDAFASALAVY